MNRLERFWRAVVLVGGAALVAALAASGGCSRPNFGAPCDLGPCGTPAGEEPIGANYVCDLQVNCDSFTCLSYQTDVKNEMSRRTPFCTADCAPDPACSDTPPVSVDNLESCDGGGGDIYVNCPRDVNGNPGVCFVTNEVVGPNEPTNCTITIGGVERNSRCECVPCCDLDPNLCRDPGQCV